MALNIREYEKETWFEITNHDLLRPFLMSVVSNSNHWMFITSNGGITAGRKNPEYALFPYYTDDKLTELADITGSKTIFQILFQGDIQVWEPFSLGCGEKSSISRNLYKNLYGNKIMFEEINHDLSLIFRYQWNTSDWYGFVKKSELINTSATNYQIKVLDGVQNIMPYGINSRLQMTTSNLADAYKKNELIGETGLGIFALNAIITDKAEPSEALKASIAWSLGLKSPVYLISALQVNDFRKKKEIKEEHEIRGEKGAYFIRADIELPGNTFKKWKIIADVNKTHSQIIGLNESLKNKAHLDILIQKDIDEGTQNLVQLVAGADGLQVTDDQRKNARHYANVLFNIMRGGIFDNNYKIEKKDFVSYLANASKKVFKSNQSFIGHLNDHFDKKALNLLLSGCGDPDLLRLGIEYLPLKFSRRHGDPSRPWNNFSINTHNELDGSSVLDYEGNWRDIFQNWEALAHSYPDFVEGMIFRFLNASTFDGYNPYRIFKGGFDWEIIEHANPWSYIGYWGDHQVVYLLKFLEFFEQYQPGALEKLLDCECFVYAHVPYRIKPYEEIVRDSKNTIAFDEKSDFAIRQKIISIGADGALLNSNISEIHHVNFIEKILSMLLAKISNFIPEAGIWMNTQRPEWNDANNALVGNGVSMVTLFYILRFIGFLERIVSQSGIEDVKISGELKALFTSIHDTLTENKTLLAGNISDKNRKLITDVLGQNGSEYRNKIYDRGFSGEKVTVAMNQVAGFLRLTKEYLEHTIDANRRTDHLYHSYNLITIHEDGFSISRLYEMLEGQVAAVSSGYLGAEDVLKLLDSLRNSLLYREDQNSYILYPNKKLPGFLEKNTIPRDSIDKSRLLQQLVADNNCRIINKDVVGNFHFNGNFKNAGDLKNELENLMSTKYRQLVEEDKNIILSIFENVFDHKSFTGRSGTFFAYEGLGSIYWHMVSKLHLSVQEAVIKAFNNQEDNAIIARLLSHYYAIGEGIGIHKSPELYGAFPTDPYSHTPLHRGAQQPGMTGQVKEDILVRIGELGVFLREGKIFFNPCLLKKAAFLSAKSSFEYINIRQEIKKIELEPGSLCFTFCQIPVIYKIAEKDGIELQYNNGLSKKLEGLALDTPTSHQVFHRTGDIEMITVSLRETHLN